MRNWIGVGREMGNKRWEISFHSVNSIFLVTSLCSQYYHNNHLRIVVGATTTTLGNSRLHRDTANPVSYEIMQNGRDREWVAASRDWKLKIKSGCGFELRVRRIICTTHSEMVSQCRKSEETKHQVKWDLRWIFSVGKRRTEETDLNQSDGLHSVSSRRQAREWNRKWRAMFILVS